MVKPIIILILTIILPLLSWIIFYYIIKNTICDLNCTNKKCGEFNGCGCPCKICPSGEFCDGTKCNITNTNTIKPNIKGIVYFDIDKTLTTSTKQENNKIIKFCIDNGFAVGIITASNRRVSNLCFELNTFEQSAWMPDILCTQFKETNGKMFNSAVEVDGKEITSTYPLNYPHGKSQGFIKGFNMIFGRNKNYPNIPDNRIVLFDDQQLVIDDVHIFNKNLQTQLVKNKLTLELVKNKLQLL